MATPMLFRFSLYGFLKNQQYYDPFIILAFREKGLSFFLIGLLVGFRGLAVNVMEVPTGAIADLCGRRRSMLLSFVGYIVAFAIFGLSHAVWLLFVAMFFFAIGEAFRTGTHKAMILDWLRLEGRESEKTETYGYTRSWAKIGSAVSVLIAAGLVFYRGRFSDIFLFSIIPYVLAIINFLGYPPELDGRPEAAPSLRNMAVHLGRAFRKVFGGARLRRVFLESMAYQGTFKVAKDYLQPVLKQLALALPVLLAYEQIQRTAVVVGCVYFLVFVAEALASRKSALAARLCRGESRAARLLWVATALVFVPVALALRLQLFWLAAAGFVALYFLMNLWRPITLTRLDNESEAAMGATLLSIESQAHAGVEMVLAPLLGLAVDRLAATPGEPALWAAGLVGAAVALVGALTPTMRPAPAEQAAAPGSV